MSAQSLSDTLIQLPLFQGLTAPEAAALLEVGEQIAIGQGHWLFREGEVGDALFIVLEGHVEVTKVDRDGQPLALAKLGEGSVLGEVSLLDGEGKRSASAQACSESKLLRIPQSSFGKLVLASNVAALKVVLNLARVMSRRLHLTNEKLVDMLEKGKRKEELADFQRLLSNWSF